MTVLTGNANESGNVLHTVAMPGNPRSTALLRGICAARSFVFEPWKSLYGDYKVNFRRNWSRCILSRLLLRWRNLLIARNRARLPRDEITQNLLRGPSTAMNCTPGIDRCLLR